MLAGLGALAIFCSGCGKSDPNLELRQACVGGGQAQALDAIKGGADVNQVYKHMVPLQVAIENKHDQVASALLDHGANVNYQDGAGVTALMKACQNSDEVAIKLLLSHGADKSAKDMTGGTAEEFAQDYCSPEIQKLVAP